MWDSEINRDLLFLPGGRITDVYYRISGHSEFRLQGQNYRLIRDRLTTNWDLTVYSAFPHI